MNELVKSDRRILKQKQMCKIEELNTTRIAKDYSQIELPKYLGR